MQKVNLDVDKETIEGRSGLLDTMHVPTRLEEFKKIENGWLDGDGMAPDHEGLDWLIGAFKSHFHDEAMPPRTYPTEDGRVRMEWSIKNNAMILEIDLTTHTGDWLWFDRNSSADHERILDLDKPSSWKWLVSEVRDKEAPGDE